jgi:hypothetical protein
METLSLDTALLWSRVSPEETEPPVEVAGRLTGSDPVSATPEVSAEAAGLRAGPAGRVAAGV